MAGNSKRTIVHLESTSGTGYRYTITKSKRNHPGRLEYVKYDPVIRKRVIFKETKQVHMFNMEASKYIRNRRVDQLVEQRPPKPQVAGSSPVSPARFQVVVLETQLRFYWMIKWQEK